LVTDERRAEILAQLTGIEADHGVRILFACESGSRGWGFASPDSDYDVRFLYVHPLPWYLRVRPQRDVIEQPITRDLDASSVSANPADVFGPQRSSTGAQAELVPIERLRDAADHR
jgi:hypothetical protein